MTVELEEAETELSSNKPVSNQILDNIFDELRENIQNNNLQQKSLINDTDHTTIMN